LNAVLGFAQLLQRDKRDPLSERHLEMVAQIGAAGEHLLGLIDDVLSQSKLAQQAKPPHLAPSVAGPPSILVVEDDGALLAAVSKGIGAPSPLP